MDSPHVDEDSFFARMSPFFARFDYQVHRGYQQFRKPIDGGFLNVIYSFSHYEDATWLEVHLGVRIDLVETLAFQFTTGLRGFQHESNTLVTSLGRLRQQPYFRYKMSDEKQVSHAQRDIQDYLVEEGFAWLDHLADLSLLERLFNAQPDAPNPYCYNQAHRAIRGLVLSRVVGRSDFAALRQAYAQQLAGARVGPAMLEKYQRLATFLDTFSLN